MEKSLQTSFSWVLDKKTNTYVHKSGRCPISINPSTVEFTNTNDKWNPIVEFMKNKTYVDETKFPPFEYLYMSQQTTNSNLVKQFCSHFFASKIKTIFPGSLPRPFQRKIMTNINVQNYILSEKTDGTRYMLYIQKNNIWFVNRNLQFFQIKSTKFCSQFACKGETIVDGEIIKTPKYNTQKYSHTNSVGSYSFLVFDVIVLNGTNTREMPFEKRLNILTNRFIAPVFKLFNNDKSAFPIFIHKKRFFCAKDVHVLVSMIDTTQCLYAEVSQKRVLKRFHKTDGIIFTHKNRYAIRAGFPPSYKWKFSHMITIDFKLTENNELQAWEKNNIHTTLFKCDATVFPFEERNIIVEMFYQKELGEWKFVKKRNKTRANHISVVFDTMELVCEKEITLKDIIFKVNGGTQ